MVHTRSHTLRKQQEEEEQERLLRINYKNEAAKEKCEELKETLDKSPPNFRHPERCSYILHNGSWMWRQYLGAGQTCEPELTEPVAAAEDQVQELKEENKVLQEEIDDQDARLEDVNHIAEWYVDQVQELKEENQRLGKANKTWEEIHNGDVKIVKMLKEKWNEEQEQNKKLKDTILARDEELGDIEENVFTGYDEDIEKLTEENEKLKGVMSSAQVLLNISQGANKELQKENEFWKECYEGQQKETGIEHERYLGVMEKYSNRLWEVCQELDIENDDTSQNIIKEIKKLKETITEQQKEIQVVLKERRDGDAELEKLKEENDTWLADDDNLTRVMYRTSQLLEDKAWASVDDIYEIVEDLTKEIAELRSESDILNQFKERIHSSRLILTEEGEHARAEGAEDYEIYLDAVYDFLKGKGTDPSIPDP